MDAEDAVMSGNTFGSGFVLTGFLCRLFKGTHDVFSRNNAFQMTISAHYWEASDLEVDHAETLAVGHPRL